MPIRSLYAGSTTHLPLLVDLDRTATLAGVASATSVVNADNRGRRRWAAQRREGPHRSSGRPDDRRDGPAGVRRGAGAVLIAAALYGDREALARAVAELAERIAPRRRGSPPRRSSSGTPPGCGRSRSAPGCVARRRCARSPGWPRACCGAMRRPPSSAPSASSTARPRSRRPPAPSRRHPCLRPRSRPRPRPHADSPPKFFVRRRWLAQRAGAATVTAGSIRRVSCVAAAACSTEPRAAGPAGTAR